MRLNLYTEKEGWFQVAYDDQQKTYYRVTQNGTRQDLSPDVSFVAREVDLQAYQYSISGSQQISWLGADSQDWQFFPAQVLLRVSTPTTATRDFVLRMIMSATRECRAQINAGITTNPDKFVNNIMKPSEMIGCFLTGNRSEVDNFLLLCRLLDEKITVSVFNENPALKDKVFNWVNNADSRYFEGIFCQVFCAIPAAMRDDFILSTKETFSLYRLTLEGVLTNHLKQVLMGGIANHGDAIAKMLTFMASRATPDVRVRWLGDNFNPTFSSMFQQLAARGELFSFDKDAHYRVAAFVAFTQAVLSLSPAQFKELKQSASVKQYAKACFDRQAADEDKFVILFDCAALLNIKLEGWAENYSVSIDHFIKVYSSSQIWQLMVFHQHYPNIIPDLLKNPENLKKFNSLPFHHYQEIVKHFSATILATIAENRTTYFQSLSEREQQKIAELQQNAPRVFSVDDIQFLQSCCAKGGQVFSAQQKALQVYADAKVAYATALSGWEYSRGRASEPQLKEGVLKAFATMAESMMKAHPIVSVSFLVTQFNEHMTRFSINLATLSRVEGYQNSALERLVSVKEKCEQKLGDIEGLCRNEKLNDRYVKLLKFELSSNMTPFQLLGIEEENYTEAKINKARGDRIREWSPGSPSFTGGTNLSELERGHYSELVQLACSATDLLSKANVSQFSSYGSLRNSLLNPNAQEESAASGMQFASGATS